MKGEEFVIRKKGTIFHRGDRVEVKDEETKKVISKESKIFFVPSGPSQNWILYDLKKQILYQIDQIVEFKKLD